MIVSLDDVLGILAANAYLLLLPLAIAEGPIVAIASGVLVAAGHLRPLPAFAIIVAGDLIGDALLYALGRWCGHRMDKTWARLGRSRRVMALRDQFSRRADQTLVIGKLTHGIGALVLSVAGMVRMPFSRFLVVNFVATLPKVLVLMGAGYAFASSYSAIAQNATYVYLPLFGLGAVAIYLLLFRRVGA